MTENRDPEGTPTVVFTAVISEPEGKRPYKVQADKQGITIHGCGYRDDSAGLSGLTIAFAWEDVHSVSAFSKSLSPHIAFTCTEWKVDFEFESWPTRDEIFDSLQEHFHQKTEYEFIQAPLWQKAAFSTAVAILFLLLGVRWSWKYSAAGAGRPAGVFNSLAYEIAGPVGILVLWLCVSGLFAALTFFIVAKHRKRAKKSKTRN